MRKVKLYIAISLNGKIAKLDGSVNWLESLPNPEKIDYGYSDFYKTIDTTIQGNRTYKHILSWGIDFPYSDKKNYVFTRQQGLKDTKFVEFVSKNPVEFTRELKSKGGKDIWLVGGGELNTLFLSNCLVDEIQVFVMPIILDEGIDLFNTLPADINLKLIESKSYSTGAVELRYEIV